MGATRVVWWRLQVLGGRRRGRGQHPKGEQERGVAAKPKEGGGGRLGFWGGRGGGTTPRGGRGAARGVGGKSGLPSVGSRSTAQIRSHVCAQTKFYCFTNLCLLKLQTPIAQDPEEKNKEG
jgi:hypothetical protein